MLYGGYGSDLAYDAADSTYWLLTDRGPNVDGPAKESKVFPNPGFNPHIGVFKLRSDSLVRVRTVRLCDADGTPFTGLPERAGDGTTGEFAFDMSGRPLDGDRRGIDPEGLALDADGTFWVSDEYGPYLMHFSKDGRLLRKLSPFDGGLPERYARRRPNRGLEGLCMRKSTGAIYGMLQSPLRGSKERVLPLFEMDRDGQVRDFDYPLSDEAQGVSAICALGDSSLLVLERDGKFPKGGKGFKRIFKVDIPAKGAGLLKKRLVVDVLALLRPRQERGNGCLGGFGDMHLQRRRFRRHDRESAGGGEAEARRYARPQHPHLPSCRPALIGSGADHALSDVI